MAKIGAPRITRVLLLTQWFDPEPTFKGLVFAKELARLGFAVEVVTGFPNYPGGKLYPGFRMKWRKHEIIDGIEVTRVALFCSHDGSIVRRALNYVSFALSALAYLLFSAKKPNVMYAYHPPLTIGVAAAVVSIVRRVPVVYDIQDMWPDTLRATRIAIHPRLLSAIGALCTWVYRRVDHIVVLSEGFRRLLIQRGVDETKIDVIYNWCSEDVLRESSAALPNELVGGGRFRILFAGNMGRAQALEAVLAAADLLRTEAPAVCFVFVGGGIEVERLKQLAVSRNLGNVVFLPAVSMEEVGPILKSADALLVHLKKDPLFEITIPSKTQAYMAVGRPLLMAVNGDAAELVLRSKCGVVAESENPRSIAAAARSLAESTQEVRRSMAQAGKDFYEEHLSLRRGAARFTQIFLRLANERR